MMDSGQLLRSMDVTPMKTAGWRMQNWRGRLLWGLLAGCLVTSPGVPAHENEAAGPQTGRVLGSISFPTSTQSAEAQQAFIRGMLLLHLFEYPFARAEFITAQQLDPEFAMAYWGEAMTWNHPIWDRQDLPAGRAALAKLGASGRQRLDATGDPLEQAFLASLDTLYGDGTKADRDQAYARAMERMAAQFPDNHEVQLFYALSLFGVQAGVRDIPTYMLCTALAQAVFSANPRHPGAAHYLIHGVDDPDHAVLGLAAARALSEMAPDAGHSLHMTSHIFMALGKWDDVVAANERAVNVANRMRQDLGEQPRNWGHYNFWLLYGYLQQGRVEMAKALLTRTYEEAQADGTSPTDRMNLDADDSQVGSLVQMWLRYLVETRDWDGPIAQWQFNMADAFDPNLNFTYAQALRAIDGVQPSVATQYLEQFRRLHAELGSLLQRQAEQAPTDLQYLARLEVMELQMLAGIEMARGQRQSAITYAQQASAAEGKLPYAFGPPFIDWPAAEMLGDMLADDRNHRAAVDAFELSLRRARLRSHSLLGLTQAQQRLGLEGEARYNQARLTAIWHAADAEVRARLR